MTIGKVFALAISIPLLFFCNGAYSDEMSKKLADIGPWTIKYYSDDVVAHNIGNPCAAVQYANGADLMLTADPDHPENKSTLQLFIGFGKPHNYVRVWIDDAMKFDHYLGNYWPQRHGHSGVFPLSSLTGRKLFARFEIGRLDVGLYEFPIGDVKAVSAYLHQKKCIFVDDAPLPGPLTKRQIDEVFIGAAYEDVVKRLGTPAGSYQFLDDNTEGFEWPLGKSGSVIIVFDSQKKVTQKVIKPKK